MKEKIRIVKITIYAPFNLQLVFSDNYETQKSLCKRNKMDRVLNTDLLFKCYF